MICEICKCEFSNTLKLALHLKTHNFTTKEYFDKFLKKDSNEGICQNENCIRITSYRGLKTGYSKYCGPGCVSKSNLVKKKKEEKSLEKYGTRFVFQADSVKEKCKESCIIKLGVDNASKSDIVKKKKSETYRKNFNGKPEQLKTIQNKYRETSLKNWGEVHPMKSQIIRNNVIKTNLEKYGGKSSLSSKEVREKGKITSLKKYGFESPNSSDIVKENKKKAWVKIYGVDNPSKTKKIKDKIVKTNLNKYGTKIPSQCDIIKNKIKETKLKVFTKYLEKILSSFNVELLDKQYKNCYHKHNWKCIKCGNHFIQIWNLIQQGFTCPKCRPPINYRSSSKEKELSDFIKDEIKNKIIVNNRSLLYPLELDIFIPDKKIAFEFNGLYWHSEKVLKESRKLDNFKVSNYHLHKTNLCKKLGIQLIHIFEDEWVFKQDIVKSLIRHILNINKGTRIHKEECKIKEINSKVKNKFLDNYHIQGYDNSNIKLGAFYNNKLISVMTFKNKEKVWSLNRFCSNSNFHVPGIAGKLLNYFKKNYKWEKIFSYADKRWSQGSLYYQLGFELEQIIKPDYWYIKSFKRIHRLNLKYKEDYARIWDCGSLKFKMVNN